MSEQTKRIKLLNRNISVYYLGLLYFWSLRKQAASKNRNETSMNVISDIWHFDEYFFVVVAAA